MIEREGRGDRVEGGPALGSRRGEGVGGPGAGG